MARGIMLFHHLKIINGKTVNICDFPLLFIIVTD